MLCMRMNNLKPKNLNLDRWLRWLRLLEVEGDFINKEREIMSYFEEEQEYIKFVMEVCKKTNEIAN